MGCCAARGCGWLEFCASNDVEAAELMECAFCSWDMKPSHCERPMAPLGYVTEGSCEKDMLELLS